MDKNYLSIYTTIVTIVYTTEERDTHSMLQDFSYLQSWWREVALSCISITIHFSVKPPSSILRPCLISLLLYSAPLRRFKTCNFEFFLNNLLENFGHGRSVINRSCQNKSCVRNSSKYEFCILLFLFVFMATSNFWISCVQSFRCESNVKSSWRNPICSKRWYRIIIGLSFLSIFFKLLRVPAATVCFKILLVFVASLLTSIDERSWVLCSFIINTAI